MMGPPPLLSAAAPRLDSWSLQEESVPISPPSGEAVDARPELAAALGAAAEALRAARGVTIVCHENPDADTLGGGLALARTLDDLGIDCEVVCSTAVPRTLEFLPGIERVSSAPRLNPEAIVMVDCAAIDRAGTLATWIRSVRAAMILNIDHHLSNDGYGTVPCLDRAAAATSEIVARLVRALGCVPDRVSATLLLAGVIHDTDGLRAAGTSAATLRLAADLVEAGADIADINRSLFAQRPTAALRLWGRVAGELEEAEGARIVIGMLTREMLDTTGAQLLDAEDLPELIAGVKGARIALLLRETPAGAVRVSIRTDGTVNAATLAAEFGGGGHDRAAGCTIEAAPPAARQALLESCRRHLSSADVSSATTPAMKETLTT